MRSFSLSLLATALSLSLWPAVAQQTSPTTVQWVARERMVPVVEAMPQGLDVLEIYLDLPGKHPLALLTHGTSVDAEGRARVTPWGYYNQALWFARRGWWCGADTGAREGSRTAGRADAAGAGALRRRASRR